MGKKFDGTSKTRKKKGGKKRERKKQGRKIKRKVREVWREEDTLGREEYGGKGIYMGRRTERKEGREI